MGGRVQLKYVTEHVASHCKSIVSGDQRLFNYALQQIFEATAQNISRTN